MGNFVLYSVIGSVVLTLLLNLLPMLFPNFYNNATSRLKESARRSVERHEDTNQPSINVFFPWKGMIIASVVLTILFNLIRMFAG